MTRHKPSARQQQILDFLRDYTATHGFAPSVREIGTEVGLASPSTVKHHLDALEEAGLVYRRAGSPRALVLDDQSQDELSAEPPTGGLQSRVVEVPAAVAENDSVAVPLVGSVAAGAPILAEQRVEDFFSLPTRLTGSGELFVLEVRGDSMTDAAILDGDYVVVRAQASADDGDIVAALIDDEATVKVFSRTEGHVWLLPRNDSYAPILGDTALILGKVVTIVRSLG